MIVYLHNIYGTNFWLREHNEMVQTPTCISSFNGHVWEKSRDSCQIFMCLSEALDTNDATGKEYSGKVWWYYFGKGVTECSISKSHFDTIHLLHLKSPSFYFIFPTDSDNEDQGNNTSSQGYF